MTGQSHQHRYRMFRSRDDVSRRRIDNHDAMPCSSIDVNIINPDTGPTYDLKFISGP